MNKKMLLSKSPKTIIATDGTIHNIVYQEIHKYGDAADLNHIDVSRVTNMAHLFSTLSFNGDISRWNVSNVTNMSKMFFNSQFNQDISQWDVRNVIDCDFMFAHSEFKQDVSCWQLDNLKCSSNMFFINSDFNFKNLLLLKQHQKTKHLTAFEICFALDKYIIDCPMVFHQFIKFVKENNIPLYDEKNNLFLLNIFSPTYPFLICEFFDNFHFNHLNDLSLKQLKQNDLQQFPIAGTFYQENIFPLIALTNSFFQNNAFIFDNLDFLFLLLHTKRISDSYYGIGLKDTLQNLSKMLNSFETLIFLLNKSKQQLSLFSYLTQLFFDYEKELIQNNNETYLKFLKENNKSFSDFYPYYSAKQKRVLIDLIKVNDSKFEFNNVYI